MKIQDILESVDKETQVIAGFPGIGKSYYKKKMKDSNVLDSDSSKFSWDKKDKSKRNPDFPKNYIEHIKSNIGKVDVILVSTHDEVREELEKNDIKYTLVYPDASLKDEYVERYKDRGSDDKFIKFISDGWDKMIKNLESEKFPKHKKLKKGEFLADIIEK